MKIQKRNLVLAIFFFFLQILIIIRNQVLENHQLIFFFCNHIPILLTIGFLFNKINLIKSLINVGLILQIGWILDFLSKILFNSYLTNNTQYLFNYDPFSFSITLITHFLTLSIAFFYTYKKETPNYILIYSFSYLTLIYFLTITFTNPIEDINCVFNACNLKLFQFENFTLFWLPISFIIFTIPTHYFQKFLNKISIIK